MLKIVVNASGRRVSFGRPCGGWGLVPAELMASKQAIEDLINVFFCGEVPGTQRSLTYQDSNGSMVTVEGDTYREALTFLGLRIWQHYEGEYDGPFYLPQIKDECDDVNSVEGQCGN